MNRSISSLILVFLLACSAQERPEVSDRPTSDSTMVVATESRVPSDAGPTVVFLGTSLTAGLGLERDEDTYVSVLDAMADSAGKPIHAVNAGVSGETSAGGLRRLDWVLREPIDILVIELGANDGLRGQDPAAMQENLVEIVQRARARYPDVRVIITGMEAPPNMGDLYTRAFRAVFPRVAKAEHTALVPFLLDGVAGIPELNQDDHIHPKPEGHRIVAHTVWPVLESVLDDVEGGTP